VPTIFAAEIASALGLKVVFAPTFQLNPQYAEGLADLARLCHEAGGELEQIRFCSDT
jgi:hypothetical protein